ncbi:GNAT family N-acetyltransferase [Halomicrococcus sp. NG-SE-24]|uniref:GNAT family N-acetyltransferase n=1 Tax=Halomicrococcus sp. NG-SE-24 TaxID=3436928 RepID=UPI003D972FE5
MPGTVFLGGDGVTLNTIRPDDYAFVEEQHNDPSNRRQAGISLPWHETDVAELVEERDDVVLFLVCRDEDAVGTVLLSGLDPQASRAEIGYIIHPEFHGEGYATEAADLCLEHAFDDRGLHKVWAQVVEGNEASKRVLEKLGFQQEGTLREHEYANGERVDVGYYGLLSSER